MEDCPHVNERGANGDGIVNWEDEDWSCPFDGNAEFNLCGLGFPQLAANAVIPAYAGIQWFIRGSSVIKVVIARDTAGKTSIA